MRNRIIHWFSLERPIQGGVAHDVVLFGAVVAGTVGHWLVESLSGGGFTWKPLIIGFVAAFVTFPAAYYYAGLNKGKLSVVKFCVAFQNGFFWPSLLEQVAGGFKAS